LCLSRHFKLDYNKKSPDIICEEISEIRRTENNLSRNGKYKVKDLSGEKGVEDITP
jgi:hypothetical protein